MLRHDQSVPRGSDGVIHYSGINEECRKQKFDDASQWLLEDWHINCWQKEEEERRKDFNIA